MLLIFSILLPSFILYSLFIIPKEAKAARALAITEKVEGKSFKVEITKPDTKDIKFKWFIVN